MVKRSAFIKIMDKNIENKIPKIKNLFIKYGVKRAFLFGSIAKGTNTKNSDNIIFFIL